MSIATVSGVDIAVAAAVLIGLVLGGRGLRQYWRLSSVVRRAEETTATIERAAIEPVRGGRSRSYIPAVEYTYQTPTQKREGETVYPGQSRFVKRFGTEAAARNAIDSYEPGTQTRVYYDPNQPSHSFLEPEVQTGPQFSQLVVGLAALGVAVLLAVGL
ncbi:DUF3592 domain-containing protein [Halonotius terrestris]|uniref:DUF3592 domain-containing protein n=1 Tax=Halonotius terrestris TaxID=2487750 RepID=A0A8J8TCV1_9EURY|nr:DUF3592 domain-containing protein [Halonotius terrestris]TQQ82564.1 DUF3592 domain-containing protein [Halonotius terrestris]